MVVMDRCDGYGWRGDAIDAGEEHQLHRVMEKEKEKMMQLMGLS